MSHQYIINEEQLDSVQEKIRLVNTALNKLKFLSQNNQAQAATTLIEDFRTHLDEAYKILELVEGTSL